MEEDKPIPRPKRKLDLAKLKAFLKELVRQFLQLGQMLFGKLHWSPPAWIGGFRRLPANIVDTVGVIREFRFRRRPSVVVIADH